MVFVSRKRGKLALRLFRCRRANILHEMYFIMFQVLIVFMVFLALMQYINNVASDLGFEKRFTAVDIGLLTTAMYYAPGTLVHTYLTPIPFPVPMDFVFAKGTIDIKEREKPLEVMFWFLADKNLEPLDTELKIDSSVKGDTKKYPNFTYYKSGRQVVFDKSQTNPLQIVCPVLNTTEQDPNSKKIFIAKVLSKPEDYAKLDNPANRIADFIAARRQNVKVSGKSIISAEVNSKISAIPADSDIVIMLGDSGEKRESGSLVAYIPINNNSLRERKLACFIINDLLTPQTSVFYSQVMPVFVESLAKTSPLNVFKELSGQSQLAVFIDISTFSNNQIDTDKAASAILRALERYYGRYESPLINEPIFTFMGGG